MRLISHSRLLIPEALPGYLGNLLSCHSCARPCLSNAVWIPCRLNLDGTSHLSILQKI